MNSLLTKSNSPVNHDAIKASGNGDALALVFGQIRKMQQVDPVLYANEIAAAFRKLAILDEKAGRG